MQKKCLAHIFKDYKNDNQYLESFDCIFVLKINLPKHTPRLCWQKDDFH